MSSDNGIVESARCKDETSVASPGMITSVASSPVLSENSSEFSFGNPLENSFASGGNGLEIGSENSSENGSPVCTPVVRAKRKRSKAPPGKPPYSYVALINMAITSSPRRKMTLSQINKFIVDNFPYYITCPLKWRNAIRHNLTLNDCFVKLPRDEHDETKAHYWTIDPASETMFDDGSFRRRRKRYIREQDLDEILPSLVEITNVHKVAVPHQLFQPYPTIATLPGDRPHTNARRGFGIKDILAVPSIYGSTSYPTATQMMSYLPPHYFMPSYTTSPWVTYPTAALSAANPGYGYLYARKEDCTTKDYKDTTYEQYINADEL